MSEQTGIRKEILKPVRRLVVKVGTSVLAAQDGRLSPQAVGRVVGQVCTLQRQGMQVVMVSSGAIGAGLGELGLQRRPTGMARLQAAAAIGQCVLMREYVSAFKQGGSLCAQVLLTNEDLKNRNRYLNIRSTMLELLAQGIVPVVNENDTVSTEEIRFGDNDRLSALVSQLLGADLLIVLSNVDGLLRRDVQGNLARMGLVEVVDSQIESHAWDGASALGTGGMKSKLLAARMITRAGEAMVVANGLMPDVLLRILDGENVGTLFVPKKGKMAGKKRWIAYFVGAKGKLLVDEGARRALAEGNRSLLASGIHQVAGDFKRGDTVMICGPDGQEFGRGIVNYSSGDLAKICGKKSGEIFAILGRKTPDEAVHRDNLVIL